MLTGSVKRALLESLARTNPVSFQALIVWTPRGYSVIGELLLNQLAAFSSQPLLCLLFT